MASQQYENRIDIIENRANSIFNQLATDVYKKALGRISTVQNMECPEKPEILYPLSVFRSLLKENKYDEMIKLMKETIEDWKEELDSVKLDKANLKGADLNLANLQKASLLRTDLQGADLRGADLQEATLFGTNLKEAYLWDANLKGATISEIIIVGDPRTYIPDLQGADLQRANLQKASLQRVNMQKANLSGANLQGADFREANLKRVKGLFVKQICEVSTLYMAETDQELKSQIMQKCPRVLEKPE